MTELSNNLLKDFKKYLIAKDTVKKNTVQILRAEILNKSKELQRDISDEEILEIIAKQIKQKKDSLADFKKADRQDLIDQTYEEIDTLEQYMPKPLSIEELAIIVKETASEINAIDKRDMGRLIKEVKQQAGVRADGKTISDLVKQILL
ncbi:MAG: GatB/YqeY domain-containing protein [Mollicutes bacterium]|nr:GatB/YqeY domain-containing protein [Mollicutes bacterium]